MQLFSRTAVYLQNPFMKKILLLVPFVATLILGCDPDPSVEKAIIGEWKWIRSVGGFSGADTLAPGPADTVILTLQSDQTWKKQQNGQILMQGGYTVSQVTSIYTGQPAPALFLDVSAGDELLITVDNNDLVLTENHTEPYVHSYKKFP